MRIRELKGSGHWPTLLAAFLYFDISFMVWVVLGPLAVYITQELQLPIEEKFTLVAIPILAGALLRIPLGLLADHFGPKRVGQFGQVIVMGALAYAWMFGLHNKLSVEIFGIFLGFAGASFAVALPQASRWYPPKLQGLVLGIVGAGNMGVVLDSLTVPWLAENYGWQSVFGFLLIPVVIVFVLYSWMAKDAPVKPAPVTFARYSAVLKDSDTWWFMFFYSITFGGFVGLAGALPLYFTNWYHVSGITAGLMVAIVIMAGSLFRPVGGLIADRMGGIRTLQILFGVVASAYLAVSFLPEGPVPAAALVATAKVAGWGLFEMPGQAWLAVAVFFVGTLALGMGNGAVFQLVPQRFRSEMGVVTGLVGAGGGLGGFVLAKSMGWSKALTGDFAFGFWVFCGLALVGLMGIVGVKKRWRTTWGAVSGARV